VPDRKPGPDREPVPDSEPADVLIDQSAAGVAGKPAAATVTIYPDGPLVLRGDFAVREVDGTPVATPRTVALCRCGRSAVKPLCDGSHKRGSLSRSAD
jgi:Iron-binding zinc finger CDGSH type